MPSRHLPTIALICLAAFTQAQTIPVPDNLITEGIPPIPQSVVDSVGRYTEFRSAFFAGWSPTKHDMLVLTRFGNTTQVHSVAMPGGDRHQLTFFPDSIEATFYGPKNPNWFLFHKDVGGNEFYQYYRYDLATGNSTLLTDGKSRNTDGIMTRDGKYLVYMSTRRTGDDTDLYEVDPENPASDHMVAKLQGGGWTPSDVSDDGSTALLMNYVSVNESHLYLADMKTGQTKELTPASGDQVAYSGGNFSRDGKHIYFTSDQGSEFAQLREMDLASGKTVSLTSDIPWDVETVSMSNDRTCLAFTVNNNGMSDLYTLDTKTNKYRRLTGIPVGVIGLMSWSPNDRDLGFDMDSAKAPDDAFSYDTKANKLTRWTTSEVGGLNAEDFQSPQLIKWKSFDGKEISGWFTMPPAKYSGPRPPRAQRARLNRLRQNLRQA